MQQTSSFHLIVEAVAAGRKTNGSCPKPEAIEVPAGCSFLPVSPSGSPWHLGPLPDSRGDGLVLEPVLNGQRQRRLLIVNPTLGRLRVNDETAPRVTLLREGDQFQFDDTTMFHITIFHRQQTGAVPAHMVGKPCPICLTPFTADPSSICYCCPCGTVLHLGDDLACARAIRECPHCLQPVALEEGYTWLPKLES